MFHNTFVGRFAYIYHKWPYIWICELMFPCNSKPRASYVALKILLYSSETYWQPHLIVRCIAPTHNLIQKTQEEYNKVKLLRVAKYLLLKLMRVLRQEKKHTDGREWWPKYAIRRNPQLCETYAILLFSELLFQAPQKLFLSISQNNFQPRNIFPPDDCTVIIQRWHSRGKNLCDIHTQPQPFC